MALDFPLLSARTRRFSLGVARDIGVSPDGSRVVFLRSRSGADPLTCLWLLDVPIPNEWDGKPVTSAFN